MCGFCNVCACVCVGSVKWGCAYVWVLCLGVCVCVGFVKCGCACVCVCGFCNYVGVCVCTGFMFGSVCMCGF